MAMQDLLKADDIKKALDTFKGLYLAYVNKQSVLAKTVYDYLRARSKINFIS